MAYTKILSTSIFLSGIILPLLFCGCISRKQQPVRPIIADISIQIQESRIADVPFAPHNDRVVVVSELPDQFHLYYKSLLGPREWLEFVRQESDVLGWRDEGFFVDDSSALACCVKPNKSLFMQASVVKGEGSKIEVYVFKR